MFKLSKYSLGAKLGAMMIVVGLVLLLVPVNLIIADANGGASGRTSPVEWGGQGKDSQACEKDGEGPRDAEEGWIHWVYNTVGDAENPVLTLKDLGNKALGTYNNASESTENGQGVWHFYTPFFDVNNLKATITFDGLSGPGRGLVISDYCPGIDEPETGSISLTKSNLLAGDSASFTVTGPGDYDESFTLPDDGSLSWSDSGLEYGDYTITEQTPEGYDDPIFTINGVEQSPGNEATVTIGDGQDAALTYTIGVENRPTTPETGSIIINKITLGGLTGTFTFSAINDETDEESTTEITITGDNNSDQVTISDLEPGPYTVTEAEGDFITTVDVTGGEVTVVAGESVTVTFVNSPEDEETGAITINKITTGGLTGTFIFTAENDDGETFITSITIDEGEDSDQAVISDLDPGDYTVTEAEGDFITTVDVTDGEVTVVAGGSAFVTFTNSPEDGEEAETGVLGITEPPTRQMVEVLGISDELPYTGYNTWYYIAGIILVLGGVLLIQLLRKRERVEYFI